MPPKGIPETEKALLVHIAVFQGIGDERNSPVPHLKEIVPGDSASGLIVQLDVIDAGQVKIAIREHAGDRGQGFNIFQMAAEGAVEQRPRHVPAPDVLFHGAKIIRNANQRKKAFFGQIDRQRSDVGAVIGVEEYVFVRAGRLNDDRDEPAFPLGQRAGRLVRNIAELVNQCLDARYGLLGHPLVVSVDDVGHRGLC